MTIYDNVALAPRLRGVTNKAELNVIVERCLTRAALWDEVKDRLDSLGSLYGGQQQRLTIARALSQDPTLLCSMSFQLPSTQSQQCVSKMFTENFATK